MECHLQKLFGTDGDLGDEDFLSAVEDAENQFMVPRHSPPRGHPLSPPPHPPCPLGPSPTPPPPKPPGLRPLAGQGCQGPPPRGAAPQDELDNELLLAACMELEGPELLGGHWEKPPPGQQSPQDPAIPKKLRVGEGSPHHPLPPTPQLVLRPSTARAPPHPGPPTLPPHPAPSLRPFQAPPCQLGARGPSLGVPRTPSVQGPQVSPRPPTKPTLMSCVEPPPRQPPCPPAPSLQTPVVTNHLVQLVTATSKVPRATPPVPPPGRTRRFPGPAGILPKQHPGKLPEEILVSAPQTPAHGALAKPRTEGLPSSSPPTEDDFGKGPWLAMKTELGLDERDLSCFLRTYSVAMVLRKAALKQLPKNKVPSMAVMIRTLTRTNGDAGAVFRDPTGEMQGTVHRVLLEERQRELKPGSVLVLREVGVFSPSHRNHYLNVTPNNLLRIYPPEPEGSCSQQEQAGPVLDHPTESPWGVPALGDKGQWRMGSTEQSPGGFSLCLQSPELGQEEPMGAAGCDGDDLDGLLGELPEDFFSAPAQANCC